MSFTSTATLMPKSLLEYAAWLANRDLIWPKPPKIEPVKAKPFIKPLPGIRAVTWSIYGTLLRISGGVLEFDSTEGIQIQIALEKTIDEFNMWNSMTRKPGAPWETMLPKYRRFLEERRMVGTERKGDVPEVDSAEVWLRVISGLLQKEYDYDQLLYGDLDDLAEKIALFFHANLQGVEASPHALQAVQSVSQAGIAQGVLADGQWFTLAQMLQALGAQGTLPPLWDLFDSECMTLSCEEGVRKPSKTLYETSLKRFAGKGIPPGAILHVGTRLKDDLAIAKEFGMRTALYTGDRLMLKAEPVDLKNPDIKPDRLLTDLDQIRDVLGIV